MAKTTICDLKNFLSRGPNPTGGPRDVSKRKVVKTTTTKSPNQGQQLPTENKVCWNYWRGLCHGPCTRLHVELPFQKCFDCCKLFTLGACQGERAQKCGLTHHLDCKVKTENTLALLGLTPQTVLEPHESDRPRSASPPRFRGVPAYWGKTQGSEQLQVECDPRSCSSAGARSLTPTVGATHAGPFKFNHRGPMKRTSDHCDVNKKVAAKPTASVPK